MTDTALTLSGADREVDARGLNCPLPILRTKKALNDMKSGQVLKVVATDSSGHEHRLRGRLQKASGRDRSSSFVGAEAAYQRAKL